MRTFIFTLEDRAVREVIAKTLDEAVRILRIVLVMDGYRGNVNVLDVYSVGLRAY